MHEKSHTSSTITTSLFNTTFAWNTTRSPAVKSILIPVKHFTVVDVFGLIILGILVIFIIGGNILVISAFATVGRKIRTVTNYFVVSLAVSDILVGAFSVPFWMWVQISKFLFFFVRHFPELLHLSSWLKTRIYSFGEDGAQWPSGVNDSPQETATNPQTNLHYPKN